MRTGDNTRNLILIKPINSMVGVDVTHQLLHQYKQTMYHVLPQCPAAGSQPLVWRRLTPPTNFRENFHSRFLQLTPVWSFPLPTFRYLLYNLDCLKYIEQFCWRDGVNYIEIPCWISWHSIVSVFFGSYSRVPICVCKKWTRLTVPT